MPETSADTEKQKRLVLIDGSGYIFRAYHGLPPLTRKSDGLPVGAVAGFCNMLFKLIKEQLAPGSRTFLVKQGHHSVVCQLDLKGFDRELAVISSRASSVEHLHRIMKHVGEDPSKWLPLFQSTKD